MVVVGRRPYFPVGTDPFSHRSNRNPLEKLDWKSWRRSRWEPGSRREKRIWGVERTTHRFCPSLCGMRPSSQPCRCKRRAFRSQMDGSRVGFPRNHVGPEGHAFSRKVLRLLRLAWLCGRASTGPSSSTRATFLGTVAPPVRLDSSGLRVQMNCTQPVFLELGTWKDRPGRVGGLNFRRCLSV